MLAKLAVLAVLLFIGWNAFKWIKRLNPPKTDGHAIEAETCETCGAYVAEDDPSPVCDEKDCPYK